MTPVQAQVYTLLAAIGAVVFILVFGVRVLEYLIYRPRPVVRYPVPGEIWVSNKLGFEVKIVDDWPHQEIGYVEWVHHPDTSTLPLWLKKSSTDDRWFLKAYHRKPPIPAPDTTVDDALEDMSSDIKILNKIIKETRHAQRT